MSGTGAAPSGGTRTDEDIPARPVGRADATGPLPVVLPTDATGPLPADATSPLPADVGEPEPDTSAIPESSGVAATPPPDPTPPPGPTAPPTVGLPLIADDTVTPATFVPRDDPAPVAEPETVGLPSVPVAAPPPAEPAALFDPGPPHRTPDAPLNGAAPNGAADLFNPDLAHPGPPPAAPPTTAIPVDVFDARPAVPPRPGSGPGGAPPPASAAGPSPSMFSPTPTGTTGPVPPLAPPSGRGPGDAPPGPRPPVPVPPPTTALPQVPRPADAEPGVGTPAAAADSTGAWSFAGGARPTGRDAPSTPPPAPAGAPASGALSATATAAAPRRKRRVWPLTLVGVLVAIVAGVALTLWLVRTQPGQLVDAAATEAESWSGARYQGTVAALDGGEIRFDLTVTGAGSRGSLSRDGGNATAEIVSDGSGILLRGDREWWLYHHAARADDLADTWVADPLTETQEIDPLLALHPHGLALDLRPEGPPRQWEALERLQVDGQDAFVLVDGTRRVAVAASEPHPPLALDVGPGDGRAPVRVNDVPAEDAGTVAGAAEAIRAAEAPKSLAQRLQERPEVAIVMEPESLCVTETCRVTITVTNSGTSPARGRLEVSADGAIVANHPLDVQPGQVATFDAAAPNPQFATPGATGQILWESRAVDD
ncbi:hypothetical protein [Pseudonocardia sp. MH-G8]|uniref:hypothetical protein n=1 Tax=Pseudonocardia sp. MH-G8 TaxID=1854588 RepID=UPI000BA16E7F|nr:hypothetical protein [Pseudonocardia sp. MH-G8]OZM79740.1 hypothetical protein CFP66_24575 [Pseudonocardia sp. MH-G8]